MSRPWLLCIARPVKDKASSKTHPPTNIRLKGQSRQMLDYILGLKKTELSVYDFNFYLFHGF
jgi:hypothetical protein